MALLQSVFLSVLLPTLIIFLFIGSLFALVVGTGLIVRSDSLFPFFRSMNRWVSTRGALKQVETPRNIENTLHRQGRLLGAVFLAGAVFSIAVLIQRFDVNAVAALFGRNLSPVAVQMAMQALKWFLLVCNALAVLVGLALIVSPQILARFEAHSNRWHSSRNATKDMDVVHLSIDKWVEAHPRGAGWIIIVLAVFVALNLGMLIFVRA